ncbi:MAG TPA: hypothetical protein VHZ03_29975 [Trebonia sp.]|jgi:hypothetical protein|nr:hypothetical protein [Trebonia sp.]
MSDIPLPIGNAYVHAQLTARQLHEKTGLSLRELAEMDLSDYSRLAYGLTPAEAGIAAFNRQQDAPYARENPAPQQAPTAPQSAPTATGPRVPGV